jgi:hypothetical protein
MNYYKSYLQDYRTTYSWSWQYGYSQVTEFVRDNYNKYNKIIITKKYGEPHEFILFNLKWPSQEYINDANLTRFEQTNWFWVDSFDKFYFVNDWQVKDSSKGEYTFVLESKKEVRCPQIIEKCLLITSPGNVPEGWTKIKETTFLDGRPAFGVFYRHGS